MAGYSKSWTDKFQDEWYLGLKLNERGVWDQLPTLAKQNGDTGDLYFKNWDQTGASFGTNRTTIRRILFKMAQLLKVEISQTEAFIKIKIVNYEYNQRVRKVGDPPASQKVAKNLQTSRAEQIRAEQSSVQNTQTPSIQNPEIQKIYESIRYTDLNQLLKFDGHDWIGRLVKKFGTEKVQAGFDSMISKIANEGFRITNREAAWKWIGGEKEKGGSDDEAKRLFLEEP